MNELVIALIGAIIGGAASTFANRQSALYQRRAEAILDIQRQFEEIARDLNILAGQCFWQLEEVPTVEAFRIISEDLPELQERSTKVQEKTRALRTYWLSQKGWFEADIHQAVEVLQFNIAQNFGKLRYHLYSASRFHQYSADESGRAILRSPQEARALVTKVYEVAGPVYRWSESEEPDGLASGVAWFGEHVATRTVTPLYYYKRRFFNVIRADSGD